jgi:DNA polymerase delta subunit 2
MQSKFCDVPDPLDLLESTLRWGHLAPTAPDSLPCYPMNEDEPFVLSAAPHIYFAANQTEFRTRLVQGEQGQRVRLVLVPKFSTSNTAVLVNLDTLECEPVHFSVPTM